MRCPRCLHRNPDDARFCNRCAQALSTDSTDRTVPARADPEGERKLISVLFADVKGSMGLLAGLDPEEARSLLDPVLEHMIEAVRHHGGTVNQVMGDGIMALFGAPIADEQHAARACFAALRMQENSTRLGNASLPNGDTAVRIRVGINSGEVVLRSIDSDLHSDYTAVGQTTHLAARMEQLAAPGSILVTAQTLRLAKGCVQVRALGPVPVSGLREAVDAFELVGAGAAQRLKDAAGGQASGQLVGREKELRVLADASELVRNGLGQMVTVVGEAGVGKSRLLHEFVNGVELAGWLVFDTACVSYGGAGGYLPMIEALKPYFSIVPGDDPRAMLDRVAGRLLALDASLERALPGLWTLFDLRPADGSSHRLDLGHSRQAIIDAIRWIVVRECQVQPVVLVVEDLHWIDAETSSVLEALVDALPDTRLLVLASCRPGPAPAWLAKPCCRELALNPLPRGAVEELLDALLGNASELDGLRQQLIDRTAGNPFFIRECIAALVDAGVLGGRPGALRTRDGTAVAKVPATVQSLLAARIDRLDPGDKRLLQAAAVVGEDFALPLLQSVADVAPGTLEAGLARLQAADLLRPSTRHADPGCAFKHVLIHEVAYASLLGPRRRELHARVVAAMEGLRVEGIEDPVDRLARHALGAGLNDKAFLYLVDAGDKALARSASVQAAIHYEEALRLVPGLPESPRTLADSLRAHHGLGCALRASQSDRAADVEACFERAIELCDRIGATADRFPSVLGLWACHYGRGHYRRALELAGQLSALAGDADEAGKAAAQQAFRATTIAAGCPADVLPPLQRDLERGDRLPLDSTTQWDRVAEEPAWWWHQMRAVGTLFLGDFDLAHERAMRGVHWADRTGQPFAIVLAHYAAGLVCYHRGDMGAAMLHAKAAADRGHMHGLASWPDQASILLARLLVESGRTHEAVRLAQAKGPGSLHAGRPWSVGVSAALAADLYRRAGQADRGLALLRSLDPQVYDGLYGPELHRVHAALLLVTSPEATGAAEAHLEQALALARGRQLKALELRVAITQAQLLALRDRRAARGLLSLVDGFRGSSGVTDVRTARILREWLA